MPGQCPDCEGNGVAIYPDGDSGDCLTCDGSGLNEDAADQLVFPLIGGGCECMPSSSKSNTENKEQTA